jgi:hypothetical protein
MVAIHIFVKPAYCSSELLNWRLANKSYFDINVYTGFDWFELDTQTLRGEKFRCYTAAT